MDLCIAPGFTVIEPATQKSSDKTGSVPKSDQTMSQFARISVPSRRLIS